MGIPDYWEKPYGGSLKDKRENMHKGKGFGGLGCNNMQRLGK
jgi:hypothetical protein